MSQENVEIVRQIYKAFAAGGVEAALPYLAPNGVLYPFPEWPGPSAYRGRDGLRTLLAEWIENFDDFEFEIHETRAVGDRVLLLAEMVGRIKGSGVPIRQPLGAIYSDFRDGQIGEGRFFLTLREALEAAGLSEYQRSRPRPSRLGRRLLPVAGLGVDRREVRVLVGPTLTNRDDVIDLVGSGLPAVVAAVEVAREDPLPPSLLSASA